MSEPDSTFREYIETVEVHAEAVIEALDEYPEDFDNLHEAVRYAVGDAQSVIYPAHALAVVRLSPQDPDDPEFGSGWREHLDLDARPSWGEVVGEMARVCLYSDVYGRVSRCPDCHSMGYNWSDGDTPRKIDCETCNGTGKRSFEDLTGSVEA